MTTYYGILTKVGEAKEANAKALGIPILITSMEVGDGGGTVPTPDREQTSLIGKQRTAPINLSYVDPANASWLVVEQVIPENVGGWWIRELGLRDADGDLIAVANCPPTYKPLLAEGSSRTQVVRMVLLVTSSKSFELKIDPSVVLATRKYVDDGLLAKLGKNDTAAAATKLATGRKISISGGATAAGVSFDGTQDIEVKVTSLDVSKASTGTLAVARGGTGLAEVADKEILVGNSAGGYTRMSPDQVRTLLGAPKICSILDLPETNVGSVVVAECGEVWNWTETPYFTGYRSPLCGRPVDGHTLVPLVSEVDAIGGLLPKVEYRRLWAYAQENGLVVSQAFWDANKGGHYFVDVDADYFQVPDLRNMFRRYTGTDADTANARTLGSKQGSAIQSHRHPLYGYLMTANGTGGGLFGLNTGSGSTTSTSYIGDAGGAETRSVNGAYLPRVRT